MPTQGILNCLKCIECGNVHRYGMIIHYISHLAEAAFHKRAIKDAQRPFHHLKHTGERLRSLCICSPLVYRNVMQTFRWGGMETVSHQIVVHSLLFGELN